MNEAKGISGFREYEVAITTEVTEIGEIARFDVRITDNGKKARKPIGKQRRGNDEGRVGRIRKRRQGELFRRRNGEGMIIEGNGDGAVVTGLDQADIGLGIFE